MRYILIEEPLPTVPVLYLHTTADDNKTLIEGTLIKETIVKGTIVQGTIVQGTRDTPECRPVPGKLMEKFIDFIERW
jgi:hypothetical protein